MKVSGNKNLEFVYADIGFSNKESFKYTHFYSQIS